VCQDPALTSAGVGMSEGLGSTTYATLEASLRVALAVKLVSLASTRDTPDRTVEPEWVKHRWVTTRWVLVTEVGGMN
jgi:hypothetical protein